MKALIRKIFEKASFHGFVYVVRRDIHWCERILWGGILFFVTYNSVAICWNQWERFKENPMVMSVERVFGTKEFPYMDVTVCSNYFDDKQAEAIVEKTWKVRPEEDKFTYYMEFLQLLTTVRYDNLETLQPYTNDTSVDNVNFLQILWEIRSTLYSKAPAESGHKESNGCTPTYGSTITHPNRSEPQFHSIITEIGMCETTSYFHEYQNPQGFQREPDGEKDGVMCGPFDVCILKVTPSSKDGHKAISYIHDIGTALPVDDDKLVIRRRMVEHEVTHVDVMLQPLEAENHVRDIPIVYRKCRFADENNLKYFNSYSSVHCRIECRIQAALELCHCRPFFYVIGTGPMCTIQGMLCLAQANWKNTECKHCYGRCSFIKYKALQTIMHDYSSSKFETTLLINLSLPKIGYKRLVVFSFDQLVVTFGGAASLFLGCSFLSFAQILYYCLQSLGAKLKDLCRKCK